MRRKRKTVARIVLILMLLWSFGTGPSPLIGSAAAQSAVTLNLNPDTAIPGADITASGTADADVWVSLKVVDMKSNVVFF